MTPFRSSIAAIAAVLALVAIAFAGPAWAHVASNTPPPQGSRGAVAVSSDHVPAVAPGLTSGKASGSSPVATADARGRTPGSLPAAALFPWILPLAALFGAALAWRRPRHALLLALVLAIGLFAYETGLHSVHHGFDRSAQQQCPVSAASLHVAAVTVDAPSAVPVSPLVAPVTTEMGAAAPSRLVRPNQGRAPPAA